MARGRSPGYDDQREMILRHAAELFARRGYPATSMNEVAEACGLSKPTLYHYFRDKYNLLVHIADGHVSRLQALVEEVEARGLAPEPRLRELIHRFVEEYAHAHHAHRVLTEDVRFLQPEDSERILGKERAVVAAFATALAQMRPDTEAAGLEVPFSCTSGVCGTCRAKCIEGAVRMERNFALDKAEVAAGFVLTCQCRPLSDKVVLSFDER